MEVRRRMTHQMTALRSYYYITLISILMEGKKHDLPYIPSREYESVRTIPCSAVSDTSFPVVLCCELPVTMYIFPRSSRTGWRRGRRTRTGTITFVLAFPQADQQRCVQLFCTCTCTCLSLSPSSSLSLSLFWPLLLPLPGPRPWP